jgi:uncharacterized membrane protein YkvA (DUF1232 family)
VSRRSDVAALARVIPDCIVLLKRLIADDRVPRRTKLLLILLIAYLASPIDLIPDFIPVIGQLDDAAILGLALRAIVRSAGPALLTEHWPGPARTLRAVLRLAGSA